MIYRLCVPLTIENNAQVRVLEWHVAPGERIAAGDLLVELETHKALIEVRAEQPGILRERHCGDGEWCPLGGLLAVVSDDADEALAGPGSDLPVEFLIG